ncbi:pilus (MSHA type) biogenesis protein MshL [Neptuniibacter sp.]|uniref:pilus (MSHA type) biogenesis protein MshL n=1 Tax=Neptuniibacter sp. TaxID=1962643 RepID=UPI00262974A6|nr:pilus (MSHA type) biogenesis protein MshL [Neptuniibacter sp.]MCP4595122.1 pilus (MSHA type) biogenesis protein MshL [Neptuniibacter sp.]
MDNKILRLAAVSTCIVALTACSANVSNFNKKKLKEVDEESHELISDRVAIESKKLLEYQEKLLAELTKIQQPQTELEPVEPEYNPLDAVNISVDIQDGDVQGLLKAIAMQAKLSLLLDPELSSLNRKITLSLNNVPASQVFDHVMDLLDLSSKVQGSILIVRPHEEKAFDLDFLQSTSQMNINMGGDVFGANGDIGGDGGGSSSMTGNLSLTGSGNQLNDPYEELDSMLQKIIGKAENADENEAVPGVENVVSRGGLAGGQEEKGQQAFYSLNRMTGTLFVKARPSKVKIVSDLVERYKDTLGRQVLIEAQILDIGLNENFNFGVDWKILRSDVAASLGSPIEIGSAVSGFPNAAIPGRTITIPGQTVGSDTSSPFSVGLNSDHFSAILDMMQQFGTVRVLSNPVLRAKNSRPSFISVGRNTSYIAESSATVTTNGGSSTTTADVTTSAVFDGIILGVEPFIAKDGKIHLTVHPMQSEVNDTSLALVDAGGGTKVTLPVVDFKGLTTSLSLNSGDTVILGGLTDEIATDSGGGIPSLSDIDGLGRVFGSNSNSKTARELVIVLRVTRL